MGDTPKIIFISQGTWYSTIKIGWFCRCWSTFRACVVGENTHRTLPFLVRSPFYIVYRLSTELADVAGMVSSYLAIHTVLVNGCTPSDHKICLGRSMISNPFLLDDRFWWNLPYACINHPKNSSDIPPLYHLTTRTFGLVPPWSHGYRNVYPHDKNIPSMNTWGGKQGRRRLHINIFFPFRRWSMFRGFSPHRQ